jgi:hypothetical protein
MNARLLAQNLAGPLAPELFSIKSLDGVRVRRRRAGTNRLRNHACKALLARRLARRSRVHHEVHCK